MNKTVKYVIGRLLFLIPIMLILSFFVFALTYMSPLDPVTLKYQRMGETPDQALIEREKEALAASRQAGKLSRTEQQVRRRSIALLEKLRDTRPAPEALLPGLRALIAEQRAALGGDAAAAGRALENSFAFCERAFGEGQELLILVTELTADSHSAHFIARYGSEGYYRHNQALLVYERQQTILRELDALETANP